MRWLFAPQLSNGLLFAREPQLEDLLWRGCRHTARRSDADAARPRRLRSASCSQRLVLASRSSTASRSSSSLLLARACARSRRSKRAPRRSTWLLRVSCWSVLPHLSRRRVCTSTDLTRCPADFKGCCSMPSCGSRSAGRCGADERADVRDGRLGYEPGGGREHGRRRRRVLLHVFVVACARASGYSSRASSAAQQQVTKIRRGALALWVWPGASLKATQTTLCSC